MHGGRVTALAIGALMLVTACAPAGAQGAVSFGSALDRAPSAGDAGACGGACTLQQARFAGAPVLSPVKGVITSWRVRSSGTALGLRLRVIGATGARGGGAPTTASAGITRHPARVPVGVGDGIALDFAGGASIAAGDLLLLGNSSMRGWRPQLAEGENRASNIFELGLFPWELLLNATVEGDADADGFGDESQDGCPLDPARQSGCGSGSTGGGGGSGGGGNTGRGGTGGGNDPLRVRISAKPVRLDRRGITRIGLDCPARVIAPCQGTLLLETEKRVSSQGSGRPRRLRLGGAPFSIPAGRREVASVPVTAKNRKILRRVGPTKVIARANTLAPGGSTTAARVTILLRPR